MEVCENVAEQISAGDTRIFGVMIESNLVEGRQDLCENLDDLVYGQSITDACIGFDDTVRAIEMLNEAVEQRRLNNK